ncbi:hypothetical protein [Bartonella sp. LJL80]
MKKLILYAMTLFAMSICSAAAQELPKFDPPAHCKKIAEFGGTYSSSTYNGCIELEQRSYDKLKADWDSIPAETRKHCNEIASFGGGDYSTLSGCIELEKKASTSKPEFKF